MITRTVASFPLVAPHLIDALIGGLLLVSLLAVASRSGDFISKLLRKATEDSDVGAGGIGSQLQASLNIPAWPEASPLVPMTPPRVAGWQSVSTRVRPAIIRGWNDMTATPARPGSPCRTAPL